MRMFLRFRASFAPLVFSQFDSAEAAEVIDANTDRVGRNLSLCRGGLSGYRQVCCFLPIMRPPKES